MRILAISFISAILLSACSLAEDGKESINNLQGEAEKIGEGFSNAKDKAEETIDDIGTATDSVKEVFE